MAVKSSLKNMVLCLTAVCLVCSTLLGVVYVITEQPIKDAAQKALQESVGKVLPQGGTLSDKLEASLGGVSYEYYTSLSDNGILGYAVKSSSIGFGGPLVLMVGVLPDGSVYNTSVLECNETPGLGAKCNSDESFISQWKGYKGVFKVVKDGGDVDAITASTITSRAYAKAVESAVLFVESLKKEAANE